MCEPGKPCFGGADDSDKFDDGDFGHENVRKIEIIAGDSEEETAAKQRTMVTTTQEAFAALNPDRVQGFVVLVVMKPDGSEDEVEVQATLGGSTQDLRAMTSALMEAVLQRASAIDKFERDNPQYAAGR